MDDNSNNLPETNGKRRMDGHDSPRRRPPPPAAAGGNLHDQGNNDDDVGQFLSLSLSSVFPAAHNDYPPPQAASSPPPLSPPPPQDSSFPPPSAPPPKDASFPPPSPPPPPPPSRARRGGRRRNPSKSSAEGKSETVTPPFPWATNRRATVYTTSYLISTGIITVSGDVQCKRCERNYTMEYDLDQKFREVGTYIAENKAAMHHRAPKELMNPTLPRCRYCDQDNSVRPVIPDRKRSINWLFLLLGKMLGCCTLDQLKYFCKHTNNHRTGAKDRVLFLTYLELCKQLDPNGPFAL